MPKQKKNIPVCYCGEHRPRKMYNDFLCLKCKKKLDIEEVSHYKL